MPALPAAASNSIAVVLIQIVAQQLERDFAQLDTAQAVLDAVRAELGHDAAGAIAGLLEKPSDINVIDVLPQPIEADQTESAVLTQCLPDKHCDT
jgi:hypothetical protein